MAQSSSETKMRKCITFLALNFLLRKSSQTSSLSPVELNSTPDRITAKREIEREEKHKQESQHIL